MSKKKIVILIIALILVMYLGIVYFINPLINKRCNSVIGPECPFMCKQQCGPSSCVGVGHDRVCTTDINCQKPCQNSDFFHEPLVLSNQRKLIQYFLFPNHLTGLLFLSALCLIGLLVILRINKRK